MNYRKEKGITLIALVITIIVLLILAGVTVSMITGGGILDKAEDAKEATKESRAAEKLSILLGEYQIQKYDEEPKDLERFFESKIGQDGLTEVKSEGNEVIVTIDGYEFGIDKDSYEIAKKGPSKPIEPPVIGVVTPDKGAGTEIKIGGDCGVIEIAWLDKNNNVIKNPISPELMGMKKVAWNGTTEIQENEINTNENWYNYGQNRWANATNNGSYFVWIPRYAYKIIYFNNNTNKDAYLADNTSTTGIVAYYTKDGKINAAENKVIIPIEEGIKAPKTSGYTDYIVHPAFENNVNLRWMG